MRKCAGSCKSARSYRAARLAGPRAARDANFHSPYPPGRPWRGRPGGAGQSERVATGRRILALPRAAGCGWTCGEFKECERERAASPHQPGKRGAKVQSISPCSFSAAFAVPRLVIGDAVIRWRTDGHLTAPGMELAHHACGLVLRWACRLLLRCEPFGLRWSAIAECVRGACRRGPARSGPCRCHQFRWLGHSCRRALATPSRGMVALRTRCPRADLYETSDIQPGPGASACAGSLHEIGSSRDRCPQVGTLGSKDGIHDKGAQIAQHGPQQACLGEAQASVGPVVRCKAGDQDLHLGHQAGERLRRRGGQAGHRLEVAIVSRVVLRPCLGVGSCCECRSLELRRIVLMRRSRGSFGRKETGCQP